MRETAKTEKSELLNYQTGTTVRRSGTVVRKLSKIGTHDRAPPYGIRKLDFYFAFCGLLSIHMCSKHLTISNWSIIGL